MNAKFTAKAEVVELPGLGLSAFEAMKYCQQLVGREALVFSLLRSRHVDAGVDLKAGRLALLARASMHQLQVQQRNGLEKVRAFVEWERAV